MRSLESFRNKKHKYLFDFRILTDTTNGDKPNTFSSFIKKIFSVCKGRKFMANMENNL